MFRLKDAERGSVEGRWRGRGRRGGLTFPQAFFFIKALTLCVPLLDASAPLSRFPLPLFYWNGPEIGDRTPAVLSERHRSLPRPRALPHQPLLNDLTFPLLPSSCYVSLFVRNEDTPPEARLFIYLFLFIFLK